MTLNEFVNQALSRGVCGNGDDGTWGGGYSGQCVSLVQQYLRVVFGVPFQARGNAKDWPFNSNVKQYFNVWSAGSGAQAGDVLVNTNMGGGYGHIWISLGGDSMIEQNGRAAGRITTGTNWAYNYILRPKTSPLPIAKTERMVAGDGTRFRREPNLNAEITHVYNTGDTIEMKGYVTNGQAVDGNTTWFVSKISGVYASATVFTDQGTHDLPNLTPEQPTSEKQRQLAYDAVAFRTGPSTSGTEVKQRHDTGTIIDMKGWVHGAELSFDGYTSDIWFVSKNSTLYAWSGFFTNKGTNGLEEIVKDVPEVKPAPEVNGLKIIDISSYQQDVDFKKVKAAGIDGVIIRAGHVGKSYGGIQPNNLDPTHDKYAKEARKAGLLVGHYWYCYQSLDPVEEAKAFLSADIKDGEPLFIDAEEKDITFEWVEEFKGELRRGIYYDYTANLRNKTWVFGQIWQAEYSGIAGVFDSVRSDNDIEVIMHQYTSSGSVDGISGRVDMNVFFGDKEDWEALAVSTSEVFPVDEPQPILPEPEKEEPTEDEPLEPIEVNRISEELIKVGDEYMDEANKLIQEAGQDFNFKKKTRMTAYFIGDALLLASVEVPLVTAAVTASDPVSMATAIASSLFAAGVGILTVFKLAKK